jgi:hypothetical protein
MRRNPLSAPVSGGIFAPLGMTVPKSAWLMVMET